MNNPEAVFDPRLGGKDKRGSKYRDKRMGRFVKVKPPCPPHYWLINSENVGCCKKCGEVKDFREGLRKALKKEKPYYNPRYTPKQKEY